MFAERTEASLKIPTAQGSQLALWLVSLGLALLVISPRPAFADQPSLHDAVEAAWQRLPDRAGIGARRQAAAIRGRTGAALFPNAPYAQGSYVNDKAGSNQYYITHQAEVGTPVWLPGEGRATQDAAQAEIMGLDAEAEMAHLALASQILDAATQAALAGNTRDEARRRLQSSQALSVDLARRFRIGEAAQSDALAADADAASALATLADAQARLTSAVAALATLTGQAAVPSLAAAEPQVARLDALRETHPRLVAARRQVEAAQSSLRLTRIQNRDSPEVGIQGINEKQGNGSPWNTRFGVVVRFPFATEGRNAPRLAAAEAQITAAEVQSALAERQVATELLQAVAMLDGARQGSVAATRAASSLTTRRGQIERAWRAGEMPLIEVTRANAAAFDAELARDKARTMLLSAQQRVRIAGGMLP